MKGWASPLTRTEDPILFRTRRLSRILASSTLAIVLAACGGGSPPGPSTQEGGSPNSGGSAGSAGRGGAAGATGGSIIIIGNDAAPMTPDVSTPVVEPDAPVSTCGDGILDPGETCD